MTTATDPLGPNAAAFRRLQAAIDTLSDEQVKALSAAMDDVYDATRDAPDTYLRPAAAQRAYKAIVESGRWEAAKPPLGCAPAVAWDVKAAVLVADLISAEDYAALTDPWFAAFGKPAIDPI